MHGLNGVRVLDLGKTISSAYCSELFADAGAEVALVESRGAAVERAALERFLHASKRSVTGELGDAHVAPLIGAADLLVEDAGATSSFDRAALLARQPQLVLCSISPYGLAGPYAARPATEFTIQAERGSIAVRGRRRSRTRPAAASRTGSVARWRPSPRAHAEPYGDAEIAALEADRVIGTPPLRS
jgi:crotonobetainyl-CoA:carnitine CoA-transferase CaiB-like acyl-CoA transferase